jgi:hypothetical protein
VVGFAIWYMRRRSSTSSTSVKPTVTTTAHRAAPPKPAAAPATKSAVPVTPKAGAASHARPIARTAAAKPGGPFTPIYLNFSNKPQAIIDNMNALFAQAQRSNDTRTRWSIGPRILFWAGLGLIALEGIFFALGYSPTCAFLTGGIALWVVAIFLSSGLRRAQVNAFPPRFGEFEEMVHTLRDDLRPGSGFIGNLDLTGAKQTSKVARSADDPKGRTTNYYRDQWLNFKAKMYDGNILRVSAIQRIKERNGYYGRGKVSGKMKWKPAKPKGSYQELKVRIAVNPEMYTIVRNTEIKNDARVGEYTVNAVDTEGGIVTVLASSPNEEISSESVLGVLKFAYGLLKVKKA